MPHILAQPNLQFSEPGLWGPAVDLDGGARFSSNSIGWGAVYRAGLGIFLLRGSRLFSGTSTVSRTPSKRWALGVQGETVWTTSGLGTPSARTLAYLLRLANLHDPKEDLLVNH